ncbi:MAG: tyrosine-type recombinase/integrase [Deferrisomatales bacterium]
MERTKKVNLTKELLDRLPTPEKGQAFYRHGAPLPDALGGGILDAKVAGFGVRVTASGAKAFILERRVKGRVRRLTVCRVKDLSVDAARAKAEKLVGEIARDLDPVAEKKRREAEAVTLEDAVKDYLATRDLKPRTVRDVKEAMQGLEAWQSRRLLDITPDAVLKQHRQLTKVSPARANLTMRYLRAVFNFAAEAYAAPDGTAVLTQNPVKRLSGLKAWNRVDRRQTVLNKADLRPWFQAVLALPRATPRDFLQLVILTGLRRSEALGLTWDRVDLTEKTLTIPASMNKARRDHVLPLGDYLGKLLKARKEAQDLLAKSKPEAAGPLVFADGLGRPYSNVRYALDTVTKASGVSFCIHDLRRTFATVAESLDISSYAVKRLLNHATASDVTAGYIVADTDRLRGPMQRVEDALLRLGGVRGGAEVVPLRRARGGAR